MEVTTYLHAYLDVLSISSKIEPSSKGCFYSISVTFFKRNFMAFFVCLLLRERQYVCVCVCSIDLSTAMKKTDRIMIFLGLVIYVLERKDKIKESTHYIK